MRFSFVPNGKLSLRIFSIPLRWKLARLTWVLGTFLSACAAAQATNPPVITPATGVYSTYQSTATITAEPGATILYSVDGSAPSLTYTGAITLTNPMTIKAKANLSGVDSTVTTANIQSDPNSLPVPRNGLSLWLKSDFGLVLSGTRVSRWSDLSGSANANDAVQNTNANRPIIISSAINEYPAVNFNGTSHFLNLTSGLTDLTSGFACFAVFKPIGTTAGTMFATGNTGPSDLVSLAINNTQAQFNAFAGTTASSVTTSAGALSLNDFQSLDAVHNGVGSASITVNSTPSATGTVQNLLNTARALNYIGTSSTSSGFWRGHLAELLVYSRTVTPSEQASIEAYLSSRYQLLTAASTPRPIFSVGTGTLSEPTAVAIASVGGATVYTSQNGTTPDPATSPQYQGPINISFSQTLKAIAVVNGVRSAVTTAIYNLDSTKWPAATPAASPPLQLNLQIPTTAIPK
ncbi:MAG: chitobiase/beta-hexosaminidase C-terminal domain-containing protein [Candidatus Obscuribacter sp.]|nr:chitobiase/beta-hexosaminidase C-terminal domain-containing protein [Candidatus Obscuribacter sp.]MBK9281889.1 chitobiase/beta-hexosaminidase C-terminal domain-containing protein [Candidatus Obscuribacter sp.]